MVAPLNVYAWTVAPAFEEMEKQFATEFDYRGEAKNGDDVRANLAAAGWLTKDVLVPRNHACTKSCVFSHGPPIHAPLFV